MRSITQSAGGHELLVEPETVTVYVVDAEGERALELTKHASYGVGGYFPNSEEAEDVVYAIGVKVACHVAEALYPPLSAVAEHGFPIIGGEAPILSVCAEVVGGSSCLTVHIKIVWVCLYIAAVAVHSDGYVAFEHDSEGLGMGVDVAHLGVEYVLDITVIVGLGGWLVGVDALVATDTVLDIAVEPGYGICDE